MKQQIRRAIAGGVLAALAGLIATTSSTVLATPASAIKAATVSIKDFKFVPVVLEVQAGQTVRFINEDQDAHTVTSATGAFESGGLDTGDAWTHVFSKPGKYAYFCALHPYMRATIVVRAKGTKNETQ